MYCKHLLKYIKYKIHTHTRTHTQKCIIHTNFNKFYILIEKKGNIQLFARLSLAVPSFPISLALVISLYHSLFRTRYLRAIVLSFVHVVLRYDSLSHALSCAIIVLSRTRCSRDIIVLSRTRCSRAIVLSLLYAFSSRYGSFSLSYAVAITHLSLRRPSPTYTSSYNASSLSHVDAILVAR